MSITWFEYIFTEPPIMMLLGPCLSLIDICRLTAVNQYMRNKWPVKCKANLKVLEKVMLYFKWPHLPPVNYANDACEYNVFCAVMSDLLVKNIENKWWYCVGGCGHFNGFNMVSAAFSKWTMCSDCLVKREGCTNLARLIEKFGLIRKWDAAKDHLNYVKDKLFLERKQFCFDLTAQSIFRQYYKNSKESVAIFHECPEFVSESFIVKSIEDQMKMAIPK